MNKTIQTILLILSFIVCAALGYYLVGYLDGKNTPAQGRVDSAESEQAEQAQDEAPAVKGTLQISEIETPIYRPGTGLYQIYARAEGDGIVFHLADENKNVLNEYDQRTSEAMFEVQPTKSGKYYVFVSDGSGRLSEYYLVTGCVPKQTAAVKKVEIGELASLLNGRDANAAKSALNGRIAPNCRLNCTGLAEEEPAPGSVYEVINRLKRSWESISITGINYDSQGRISSINIDVKQKQQ